MKRNILTTLFLSIGLLLNAQDNYEFSVFNDPYKDLTGSTSLNNGQIWDEDEEYSIPMGFDFEISTHTFNTIYMVDWTAGGVLSTTPYDFGIASLLIPIGQDIIDLGFTSGVSLSNISYKTEGAEDERILKIEWNNVGFGDGTSADYSNFQVWLYEGSNIVEYRYGTSEINDPYNSYDEETGPIVGFLPSIDVDTFLLEEIAYLLSGDPVNPTVVVVEPGEEDEMGGSLEGMIPTGTVYRFSPKTLSTESFEKMDFMVYPNPTDTYLQIKSNVDEYQVAVYNSMGQEVKHKTITNGSIDVSNLPQGIYFVEMESLYGRTTKKFIKN